ncbi:pentatricopeptide repeat-containing protein At2g36980, mitochondrial [Elaeis guineensis]|uniref:Pentatricopeptide repeat-containing protein At2g36980, mitochondrial n=1 Tax=Elaeis guineensis var. tenera TaxID=51953 RepID=A0A6I9QHS6_ELAGV|nr:pentatricopeptide repeat-containing protein At2g36980, mitochondrial [Elaeis guineensis]
MTQLDLISTTSKLVFLARSGWIASARKLFDEMPDRDTVSWNAMLTAYSNSGQPHRALSLFSIMRTSAAWPDCFSFTAVLAASADLHDLSSGRKLHALLLRLGLRSSLPVSNSLLDMYGKCSCPSDAGRAFEEMEERNEVSWCSLLHGHVNAGQLDDAHQVFDEMPVRKTISWNILIMGYARLGKIEHSISLFKKMQLLGVEGDVITFSSLMNACSDLSGPRFGRMIHAFIYQNGWDVAIEVKNSVLSFYAKFGFCNDALKAFESMETRTIVSWNAMIDANMKVGNVHGALLLFLKAPETNVVSWTAMISGFARNGYGEEALSLFVGMKRKSLAPDDFTFGAVLQACAMLTVLANGRMTHNCVIHCGFDYFLYVANGLVNMYTKCGDVEAATQVFDGILRKDLVSWNVMLFGFALHGLAAKAFKVYEDMLACGILPDKVTFIGLLMACSHAGFIEQGRAFLHVMESVHGIKLDTDHITCIIDMLGRAGHLGEASELLGSCSRIVSDRITDTCEALLSACAVHGDMRIGKMVGEQLVRMEPQKEVGYVILSNLYCVGEQWREAEKVRRVMMEQGVQKVPGCSWIEVSDMVMEFVSGSQSVNHMIHVHNMIGLLNCEMRNPSFVCLNSE